MGLRSITALNAQATEFVSMVSGVRTVKSATVNLFVNTEGFVLSAKDVTEARFANTANIGHV